MGRTKFEPFFYESVISKNIIITNPIVNPKLASILFSLNESGINSDEHTAIIAPAEKDKRNGSMFSIIETKIAPIIPAIISTIPEAWPIINDLNLLLPLALKAKLVEAPSGKFCIPIPRAIKIAPVIVNSFGYKAKQPNATPTAKPSGIL